MRSIYTFDVVAAVSVEAESEDEAREKARMACIYQEEDVDYNGLNVCVSTSEMMQAKLVDTWETSE